jgi:hypothetical protein
MLVYEGEDDRAIYGTAIQIEDHHGEVYPTIVSFLTPIELNTLIINADETEFVTFEEVCGSIVSIRKEVIANYTLTRDEIVNARRARKPVRPKDAPNPKVKKSTKSGIDKN